MRSRKHLKKIRLLSSLYVSQYLPVSFFSQALPVFMRQQGISLAAVGLLSLSALPLMLKFLWSPLIDRYSFARWGHYRSWIIGLQLLVAFITVVCSQLDLSNSFTPLLVLMFLIYLLCASQDIATDALAVRLLEPEERGFGNGVQNAGNYLGGIIGGGGMLILLNRWGWTASLLILALIMVVALTPVFQHRETRPDKVNQNSRPLRLIPYLKIFIQFYRRPGMGRWLLLVGFSPLGGMMANAMLRPLLVDIGLSLANIGWLLGVAGFTAGILGAVAAGILIKPLGRKRSLITFSLLWTFTIVAYLWLPAFNDAHWPLLCLIIICSYFAMSMVLTVTYTIMMDKSEPSTAGTDYTIQVSVSYLGGIAAIAISGVIAEVFGYEKLFAISIMLSLISIVMIAKVFQEKEELQSRKLSV